MKARVVHRSAAQTNDIAGFRLDVMIDDVDLFIGIRIELHAALLHAQTAEMLARVKGIATVIAFHAETPCWRFIR